MEEKLYIVKHLSFILWVSKIKEYKKNRCELLTQKFISVYNTIIWHTIKTHSAIPPKYTHFCMDQLYFRFFDIWTTKHHINLEMFVCKSIIDNDKLYKYQRKSSEQNQMPLKERIKNSNNKDHIFLGITKCLPFDI